LAHPKASAERKARETSVGQPKVTRKTLFLATSLLFIGYRISHISIVQNFWFEKHLAHSSALDYTLYIIMHNSRSKVPDAKTLGLVAGLSNKKLPYKYWKAFFKVYF
jgi:hypothetical protein